MGLLAQAFSQRKASDPLALFAEIYNHGKLSKSGQTINLQNAFRVSVAFACLKVLSQGGAQVPFKLFRQSDANGLPTITAAKDHQLYDLVATQPNAWSTSFEFRETLLLHAALGNAYAFLVRGVGGVIREMILLDPSKVQVEQGEDWSVVYKVTGQSGAARTFPAEAVWHVRGPSWNGYAGMDTLALAREALGLSIATEESHAKLHEKGVRPSGTYSVEGTLSPEQYKSIKAWIIKENAGADNSGAPMILDRGAKWLAQTMTGLDSQHLETRKFQIEEVCRFFGVMPIMVGYSDKAATYASAEQMFLAHVVHTLSPWYARVENSADVHLLTKEERASGLYFKFVAAGLLRGAAKDRAEYYAKALGSGGSPAWMTQDEIRGLEELNPMGGEASELPKPPEPAAPVVDEAADAKQEAMHSAVLMSLKREQPANVINLPAITISPATVKAGDVHVTIPEGAIQVKTIVEPAQIKAGDVHIAATENHINVQHPRKSATVFERDPTTLELKRSETKFEVD